MKRAVRKTIVASGPATTSPSRAPSQAPTRILGLAIIAAFALVLASCGDDATGSTNTTLDGSSEPSIDGEAEPSNSHGAHGDVLDVADPSQAPEIDIEIVADSTSGHNVFVNLSNFEITPRNASADPVEGEGHLHIYIDGQRSGRLYNTAFHLDGLDDGEHEIAVWVSANNHSAYGVDGEPIRASQTVQVEKPQDGGAHGHDEALAVDGEAPQISVDATKDTKSGWNLAVDLDGFELDPRAVGGEPAGGKGHLHLYVDDVKVDRLYGTWWHLDNLSAGDHTIRVELAANNHSAYSVDGENISAATTISVDDDMTENEHESEMSEGEMSDGEPEHNHGGSGETLDIEPNTADVVIELTVAEGEVSVTSRRVVVEKGSSVGIIATSDVDDEIHLHGYDILAAVGPDTPTSFAFTAEEVGVFEVELEESGRFLFDIQVQ